MIFRAKKNRRRVDLARKTGELKAAARRHGPLALTLLGLVTGSALVAWGGVEGWRWARTTPRFALKAVAVQGHGEATDVELVRLAGLSLGQNLVAMDVRAMERAVATHPWVKSVEVTRSLPGTVRVAVREHRAVALLSFGDLYLVNEDAVPFKRLKAGDVFDLPVISGIGREAFTEAAGQGSEALRAAVALVDAYGATAGAAKDPLSEVRVEPEGATAITARGTEIRMGSGDVAAKLARLARVQEALRARSLVAEVIHLDNRARPAWVAVQVAAKGP